MELKVVDLNQNETGTISVKDEFFAVEPRVDILNRVVNWQRAARQAGTHKTKGISEISGTTKKPFAQKGSGNARQGSLRSAQMRGGATIFGPVVRSHAFSLNKKVRKLGLRMAVSGRAAEQKLMVLDALSADITKTKQFAAALKGFEARKCLIIADGEQQERIAGLIKNIPNVNILPTVGLNVYSILNHDLLLVAKDSVEKVEARLV